MSYVDENDQLSSNLDIKRHSLAHLTAAAILDMFPEVKLGIGPVTENGYYYDVKLPRTLVPEDLALLEDKVRALIKENHSFDREELSTADARKRFETLGQEYKIELINDLEAAGETVVTVYKSGDLVDLCKGPHVDSSREIDPKSFKLDTIAGAYWKGDDSRDQLQRVYGLAFANKKALKVFLNQREEAKKRDHRKLGKELDLFTFSELVGPGLPLWTPKGTLLRNVLDDYVWKLRSVKGYEKVEIPHITKKDLYEKSGHWDKFSDELFKVTTREGHEFAIKPMNCPHHTQIFASSQRSYKELPVRYANTTTCYRDEQTGELFGLSRVRSFSQDDAHVFCRMAQIKEESLKIWDIIDGFYAACGFKDLEVRLSLHDPENFDAYLGTPEMWKDAEEQLRYMIKDRGVDAIEEIGEAAFYGPKIDFITKDSIGREWQVATIQLDMNMPERFELSCINEEGQKESIAMIHAAIMGSIERFLSILIEHFAGAFPLWIAPDQIVVVPVGETFEDYGRAVTEQLQDAGFRTSFSGASDTLGRRIRTAEKMKVPYILVVGEREQEAKSVNVRTRAVKQQSVETVKDFIARISQLQEERSLEL